MATRSTIAMEFADGTVKQVYCHWDGYLDNNGVILRDNYTNPAKVQALIELGDISSLGPEIGEKHSFDIPFKYGTPEYEAESEARRNITTFYGRDRGEDGTTARKFKNFDDYRKKAQGEEYNYIFRADGNWYVEFYGDFDGLLSEAFEFQTAQEAE